MSATTFESCALRTGRLPSANTRTGASYFRMRSTRPARWYSAPKAVFKNPSMISLSVNVFFSARWRDAMAGISADADGGGTTASNAIAANATANIRRAWEDRSRALIANDAAASCACAQGLIRHLPAQVLVRGAALVFHDHGGADGDATIEIGDVVIGHAEAAGGYRLADRLRLVGTVDAVKRGAQIHGPRSERIVDAAGHVARQVGTTRQHLRGRGPVRPFFLGGDAVGAAPAKTVAADTDAVAKRLAIGEHEVKPPLGGIDENGSGRIIAGKVHGLARNRARRADAEVRPAAHDIAHVEALGSRLPGAGQQCHRRKQQSKNTDHVRPRKKSNSLRDRP